MSDPEVQKWSNHGQNLMSKQPLEAESVPRHKPMFRPSIEQEKPGINLNDDEFASNTSRNESLHEDTTSNKSQCSQMQPLTGVTIRKQRQKQNRQWDHHENRDSDESEVIYRLQTKNNIPLINQDEEILNNSSDSQDEDIIEPIA